LKETHLKKAEIKLASGEKLGVFLKCRMPRYRAQATTGAPVDPIPDVYYRRAIVDNGERVLPYYRPLPLIVAINFEA
jgi:hypothetical protein